MASSKSDVMVALRSVVAAEVEAAAKIMADQCDVEDDARQAYADAGAVAVLVAAMATHVSHPEAQQQLCWAIRQQAYASNSIRV